MSEQSSMHAYLDWTKQRIDEMDATLASLEVRASEVKAELKAKAQQAIADLKKGREQFQTNVRAQAQAGEAALQANKTQLESQWRAFEAQLENYFETIGERIEQQQATFGVAAAAQAKAWREAVTNLQSEAAKVAAARCADTDAAVKQMKAEALEAEGRLEKLRQAGGESWAALSAALAQSRRAFDQASQRAWEQLTRAATTR